MQTARKVKTLPYLGNSDHDSSAPLNEFTRYVNSAAPQLDKFSQLLNQKFNILRNYPSSDLTFLTQALEILSEIIGTQLNRLNFASALKIFSRLFSAENVYQHLIQRTYLEIENALQSVDAEELNTINRKNIVSNINEITFWYIRRRQSLSQLKRLQNEGVEDSCFLDLNVWQEQSEERSDILTIETALYLKDLCQQNLWLKVFVSKDGKYLNPSQNFSSWIDDSEPFETEDENGQAFALITPINPQRTQQIISDISMSLELAALDLKSGSHLLQIEIQLCDDLGERLITNSIEEIFFVPKVNKKSSKRFSPQSLGLWSQDYVSSDIIKSIGVKQIEKGGTNKIEIKFDAEFYDKEQHELKIEVRFFNQDGAFVEKAEFGAEESFIHRQTLSVENLISRLENLLIEIDSDLLDIEADEVALFCELVIFGSHNKVLVGCVKEFKFLKPAERVEVVEVVERGSKKGVFDKILSAIVS